jgi:hypothetical protein
MRTIDHVRRFLLAGSVLLAGLVAGAAHLMPPPHSGSGGASAHETVYTPFVLRRAITRAPQAWLGRVIWVRAEPVQDVVWACRQDVLCLRRQPSLADVDAGRSDTSLPLALPQETPLIAALRRAPLVGELMPTAPAIPWGIVAVYRIRLQALPGCAARNCIGAQLIQAAL